MNLHDLDVFAAVARQRSFRKAATERGVSASALSHAVRSLEERLGVRLLNRTTRSVTPTDAGFRLLARLEPAIREIGEALAELDTLRSIPAGVLRLNVPRPAARLVLAPLLAGFVAKYPRVTLEIVTDDALIDTIGEGFDAGIRFGESLAADMIAVPIGAAQRFTVVAAPAYLAVHGAPTSPADLINHACIGRRFPSGSRYAWEFTKDGQDINVAVEGPLLLDDEDLIVRAALDGAGIAHVYETQVRSYVKTGRLITVLDKWLHPPSKFFLYYPSRRQMPLALRAFIDLAKTAEVNSQVD